MDNNTNNFSKLKILDCTIRDGGYLNNWHFDLKLVREVYRAHSRSGVDFMEIGFRSTDKYFDPKKYGCWRFTPESLVSEVVKGISGPAISLIEPLILAGIPHLLRLRCELISGKSGQSG